MPPRLLPASWLARRKPRQKMDCCCTAMPADYQGVAANAESGVEAVTSMRRQCKRGGVARDGTTDASEN